PPRKIEMSTMEGYCGEDVIVGIQQKRGRGKNETFGSVTKRQRAVVKETPCQGREIPAEDTIGDPLRPVPLDSLLENVDMALLLLRERHNNSGKWKCDGLDYMQMKASMGKEDKKHIKGLLGMLKGKGLKLAKS
ncbi:PREDICTED: sentrin-specific, partial [Prunus dulcis]